MGRYLVKGRCRVEVLWEDDEKSFVEIKNLRAGIDKREPANVVTAAYISTVVDFQTNVTARDRFSAKQKALEIAEDESNWDADVNVEGVRVPLGTSVYGIECEVDSIWEL